jgi:hypothetical protein
MLNVSDFCGYSFISNTLVLTSVCGLIALTPALSHCENDSVQPRMDTDKHGFSEMIFIVSLPVADIPLGGRFGFQQNVLFIRVHLCLSVVKTVFTAPGEGETPPASGAIHTM